MDMKAEMILHPIEEDKLYREMVYERRDDGTHPYPLAEGTCLGIDFCGVIPGIPSLLLSSGPGGTPVLSGGLPEYPPELPRRSDLQRDRSDCFPRGNQNGILDRMGLRTLERLHLL